jgi:hypothetical protein
MAVEGCKMGKLERNVVRGAELKCRYREVGKRLKMGERKRLWGGGGEKVGDGGLGRRVALGR